MNNFKDLTDNLITKLNPKECYDFVDSVTFDPINIPIPNEIHGHYYNDVEFCSSVYRRAFLLLAIAYAKANIW